MLRAIRQPLLKLRASRPNDADVLAVIDAQLGRTAHRELVVEARTALVACDRDTLVACLGVLAVTTGRPKYRVAHWLSAAVPAVLPWLYRVKSQLHGARRRWRRRNARTLVP